jgi:uncharacterized protein
MVDWQANLVTSEDAIAALVRALRRVAVLGIKTEKQSGQPALYVPEYLARAGVEVVPVPVYYPEATEILGQKVYRRVAEVPGSIDLVNVFRRPNDLPQHVDDLLEAKPPAVWLQSGIRNDQVAETFARAGIKVVQDRCLMVDHQRYVRR